MPSRPPHPCARAGCATLTRERHCERHARALVAESEATRPSGPRLYDKRAWRRVRAQHLRTQPWCVTCDGQGRRTRATDVDHVQRHNGDVATFYALNNLQSLCHACHSRKTAREVGWAGARA